MKFLLHCVGCKGFGCIDKGGKDKGKKQKGQEAIDLVSGAFFLAEGPDIWPWPWRSMPGDWRATSERSK